MAFYNVYLSSTFRDLVSYREKVIESLHKVRTFKVVGMEYYTAESTQPLTRCLQDVADCHIYILILANRYGYVMDGQTESITHQEFLKAKKMGKIVLIFRADDRDGRFPPDTDEPGQPSSAEKQLRLKTLKEAVAKDYLIPPEGFSSEYHLALQVIEALTRNPQVDFDGVFDDDRKIFCDRTNQVYRFYDLLRKKLPLNVFLIQGNRMDLGRSLVDRLSKYYLGIPGPTLTSYHECIADGSYNNFRQLLIDQLFDKLISGDPDKANDPVGLLTKLKAKGFTSVALLSIVSTLLHWQKGYQFLDDLFLEFRQAGEAVGGIRLYWFIVIDSPDALQQQVKSVEVLLAPKLTMLEGTDIETWLRTYISSDDGTVLDLQEHFFPDSLNADAFTMRQVQDQISEFIKKLNNRRIDNDKLLLKHFP